MHCRSILGGHANYYIAEYEGTTLGGDLDGDYLLVGEAELLSGSGVEVDVAHGSDNTLGELNFACGANELASAGACDIAGLANGSYNADGTSVGKRELDLSLGPGGSKDGNALEFALGANNIYALSTGELAGLREILFGGELIAFAEEDGEVLFADMEVTCGNFYKNFFLGYSCISLTLH